MRTLTDSFCFARYRRGKKLKGPLAEKVKLPSKKRRSLHESKSFWKLYACAFKRTLNHVIIWIFGDFVIMWIAVLFTSVGQFTIHRFSKLFNFILYLYGFIDFTKLCDTTLKWNRNLLKHRIVIINYAFNTSDNNVSNAQSTITIHTFNEFLLHFKVVSHNFVKSMNPCKYE